MGAQDVHGLSRDLERLSRPGMDLVSEEMDDEKRDVVATFAQAGEMNGNNVESIVEIFTESSVFDSFLKRFVACRHDTNVHKNRHIVTHATHLFLLENTQQSALEHGGHGTHFIEKNCSAVGFLKEAFLVIDGPGECSFAMAKQLRFQEILR